jgi:hypothetical protein
MHPEKDIFGKVERDIPTGTTSWMMLAVHVHWFMEMASNSWVNIGDHLEQLLVSGEIDQVSIEDDEFSHSRKLFWIINKVDELLPIITDAVTQRDWYQNANQLKLEALPQLDPPSHILITKRTNGMEDLRAKIQDIEELKGRLQVSYKRFEAIRERARSLRDGVGSFSQNIRLLERQLIACQIYSLTSVTEARESRILAENVKLLTYVTIFYLPLAFCTVSVTFFLRIFC